MTITRFEPQRPSLWRRIADWLNPHADDDPPAPLPATLRPVETTATTIHYVRPSRLEILREAALLESDEALLADQPGMAFAALERWRVHYAASLRDVPPLPTLSERSRQRLVNSPMPSEPIRTPTRHAR
jgi:hypothetical protein